ncbi:MAG: hypothetical protein GYA47_10590, partial [Desulfovibrio sp.]|nr:hypothetical protein [Desulfovibrio sp.]
VGGAEDRGFARPGGRSLEEVFAERQPLYAAAADYRERTGGVSPAQSADDIVRWMRARRSHDAGETK